ncbi:SIMPL domain-containing protein [Bauldia sp.]|uniref:SIMPL domain-containing protein n=1 Tax=Bauldia sp. TaxID=2575872 RepID=UPI003BA8BCA0
MKPIVFALALCLGVSAPALAAEPRIPTLNAGGEGSVSVTPDIAIVTIGVVTREETARAALSANNADLRDVIAAIQAEGIDEADIGTSGFSVTPLFEGEGSSILRYDSEGTNTIVGYEVSNTVQVTIRDIANSGAVLDQVVSSGANRISGIRFDISDPQAASDQALAAAIAEARRRGALMAEAAGLRLVRILDVNASSAMPMSVVAEVRRRSDSVPVMPGQQQITANATITWEIAPR